MTPTPRKYPVRRARFSAATAGAVIRKSKNNSNNNSPTSANGGQMWGTLGVEV